MHGGMLTCSGTVSRLQNILMNQDRSLAKLADVGISRIVHTTIGANTSGNNDIAFPVGTFE